MEKVLLIEPNYENKYVPLGLMKISYYHKEIKGDLVWFSKGELPGKLDTNVRKRISKEKYYIDRYGEKIDSHLNEIEDTIVSKSWDRIYITTLFTFEYDTVLETINYAKSLINDNSKIYVGGILATLMPDKLREDTGVNVLTGQLTDTSSIGYNDSINIDVLTPDYSILCNTNYEYSNSNAYYTYTTRGCGMNCGFCAVKTLEPVFVPYISIKEQIQNIDRLYGPKKDMLLMDNNILKSKHLADIVQDLISLGFYKDAMFLNAKTGRYSKRYIDFNQGLDAKLMTDKKARLLGMLPLRPARVAFDHIEDSETYTNALKMLIDNGTTYLSNYLLYNSDSFSGKGTLYAADTPEDLYNRFKINVDLQVEENRKTGDNTVQIYSFPMRYIPLDDKRRGYVGPNWNRKYLRAIQVMLVPSSGKGVSNPDYFYNIFGQSQEDFLKIIKMPEDYLNNRGMPQKNPRMSDSLYEKKLKTYYEYAYRINEWEKIYNSFNEMELLNFEDAISSNKFRFEDYNKIQFNSVKKIFMHYLTPNKLLSIFNELSSLDRWREINFIKSFLEDDARYIYDEFIDNVSMSSVNRKSYSKLNDVFDGHNIIDMLDTFEKNGFKNDVFYKVISNIDEKTLYTCLHTWLRNRRLMGLSAFAVDVANVLRDSKGLSEDKRIIYIKEQMLKLFKDTIRYYYPSNYTLSPKYDLYKYDLYVMDTYDPHKINDNIDYYSALYEDTGITFDPDYNHRDVYYEFDDDYSSFDDEYSYFEG